MDTPDLIVERLVLGELPPDRERELLADPAVAARAAEIRADDARILAAFPPSEMAKIIQNRADAERSMDAAPKRRPFPGTKIMTWSAIPALAAAALALYVGLGVRDTQIEAPLAAGDNPMATERIKGTGPSLVAFIKTGAGSEKLADGTKVGPGDLLQLEYVASGKPYGMIFSVDGNGYVSLHYPEYAGGSTALEQGGGIALPYSYRLDDAPDFEFFYFLADDGEINVDRILNTVKSSVTPGIRPPDDLLDDTGGDVTVLKLWKRP